MKQTLYNGQSKNFYKVHNGNPNYNVSAYDIQSQLFDNIELDAEKVYSLPPFELFEFAIKYNYWLEISRSYITKEHIAPLVARANNRCEDMQKIFKVLDEVNYKKSLNNQSNIEVISLLNVNLAMKKIVPMIVCKTKYAEKKEAKKNILNSTLHFIIDEAHNILSDMSTRESGEWKDYRLESFEEIIKEGRKFGVFLTIASQRPSDISDTIISLPVHNFTLLPEKSDNLRLAISQKSFPLIPSNKQSITKASLGLFKPPNHAYKVSLVMIDFSKTVVLMHLTNVSFFTSKK